MLLKMILIFVFSCKSGFIFANTTQNQPQEQIKEISALNIRLQEQNEMLKLSIENYNSIIFSALGFAGTFLITFLGVNVYFVKNRVDEDKKNLERMIEDKNKENFIELSNSITKIIDEHIDHLDKKTSSQAAVISTQLKAEIRTIDQKIKYIHYDLAVNEYEKELCDGNKLTAAINLIKCSEAVSFDWRTSQTLTEIKTLLKTGARYSASELPDVFKVLRDISEPNKKLAVDIETLILQTASQ
ncbi:hypothetical protein [Aeromonas veronii]